MDNSLNLFAAFLHQLLEQNFIIYQSNKYYKTKCMVLVRDIYIPSKWHFPENKKNADLRPSLTTISVIYTVIFAR